MIKIVANLDNGEKLIFNLSKDLETCRRKISSKQYEYHLFDIAGTFFSEYQRKKLRRICKTLEKQNVFIISTLIYETANHKKNVLRFIK